MPLLKSMVLMDVPSSLGGWGRVSIHTPLSDWGPHVPSISSHSLVCRGILRHRVLMKVIGLPSGWPGLMPVSSYPHQATVPSGTVLHSYVLPGITFKTKILVYETGSL